MFELIMEVGAEGGTLSLVGERTGAAEWQFRMERNEEAVYDLLSEEDRGETSDYFERTNCVNSFPEALGLLDKYPWVSLYPLYVHPEFVDAVLFAVGLRGDAQDIAPWHERLNRQANESAPPRSRL